MRAAWWRLKAARHSPIRVPPAQPAARSASRSIARSVLRSLTRAEVDQAGIEHEAVGLAEAHQHAAQEANEKKVL